MSDFDKRRRSSESTPTHRPVQLSAGKRSLVDRRYAPVQRKDGVTVQLRAEEAPAAEGMHEAAQRGIAGSGGPLPFLDQIQRSFGDHDVSGVKAHVGGAASAASESMGAEGYATGNDVAFRDSPSLHTAAHEAAHVVQQRAGVHLKDGTGQSGDVYEQNADAVADRVVSGRSAADLLPAVGSQSASGEATQHKPIQLYKKLGGPTPYDTVSDDGKLAVKDHSREAWAEPANIAASNAILASNKSKAKIEIVSGGDVSVAPPGAAAGARATTLKKFRMVDRASSSEVELADDCGTANQQMLGAESAGEFSFVAANKRGTTDEFTGKSEYRGDDHAPGGIVSTTEKMSGEIYVRIFAREFGKTLSRVDALKEWAKLSPTEQDRLSKKYGINKYAAPKVGQGVTIGSERDMPGAVPGGYNFHFALNLMSSGADYVTLEDYDSSGVKYYFDMYGPSSQGQSFAEDPSNTGALGNKTTTMVVDHPANLDGKINADTQLVADPAKPSGGKKLSKDTRVKIIRKGHTWMKVEVTSGSHAGETGWFQNKFFEND
jgi:hypothetical protein